jgi:serine protease SohB
MLYAGEYKRTLTLFGENTDKGRAKMQEDLDEMHQLFKEFVGAQRPDVDLDKVATGEHWLATRALDLGLVDSLQTSDDYLMSMLKDAEILRIEYTEKKNIMDKLSSLMSLKWRQQQKALEDLDKPLLM